MAKHFSKITELTIAKHKMTEQYSKKWLTTTERMTEFIVATRKWLSSLKWLSTITKMDVHYSKND
jgi:hypothetical protein